MFVSYNNISVFLSSLHMLLALGCCMECPCTAITTKSTKALVLTRDACCPHHTPPRGKIPCPIKLKLPLNILLLLTMAVETVTILHRLSTKPHESYTCSIAYSGNDIGSKRFESAALITHHFTAVC